ncbi:1,4-alpha-glucan branching protein [Streptomyces sp. NBC_00083]|uniref:maltokinase N-terminal cap-like domain-containing protein n=1 Tax=Streptomyces sp. NBC_00083 TaxID=2975647 RepID=UPI0022588EE3|nr:1,4-alpha-glucan branching protein [Streptomyces sp. NBC_00083]MCX5383936.1 1,4-alpha-glucan branching protein [Streptomyces sp. NBC_00083]
MAVIHRTDLNPTKVELLTAWLPSRPWYRGAGAPELTRAGGFRLDDPQGDVGIEFLVVTDGSGAEATAYLVPLTYRGAPLDGAAHALVGVMEHGVLGRRWAYDACHDPVAVAQLAALIEGRAEAQDQNVSHVPDRDVARSFTGDGPVFAGAPTAVDDREGTALAGPRGAVLRLHRTLRPAPQGPLELPRNATGHVSGPWRTPDGTRADGLLAVLYTNARA